MSYVGQSSYKVPYSVMLKDIYKNKYFLDVVFLDYHLKQKIGRQFIIVVEYLS